MSVDDSCHDGVVKICVSAQHYWFYVTLVQGQFLTKSGLVFFFLFFPSLSSVPFLPSAPSLPPSLAPYLPPSLSPSLPISFPPYLPPSLPSHHHPRIPTGSEDNQCEHPRTSGAGKNWKAPASWVPRRHIHNIQPGHVRGQAICCCHQPSTGKL